MKLTLRGYIPQNDVKRDFSVYELVDEVSSITNASSINEFQKGVISSEVRFLSTSSESIDSRSFLEKGSASARIDSSSTMTMLRIGVWRDARGGCDRSTGGAEICWAM